MQHNNSPSDSTDSTNSPERKQQRLMGIALMCLALLCFSCLDATAKYLSSSEGLIITTFARYLFSVLIVTAFLNPWTQPGLTITRKPWMQAVRSFLLFASTILNFLALQHLQLAETMSIIFLVPLVIALLSGPILGEWVGPRRLAAIAVGFIGVLIVTRPGTGSIHPAALYSFAGVFCYAFYAITTRILAEHDSTSTTLFYSGLGGLVLLLPVVPFFWKTPDNGMTLFLMLVLGGFGALGHWLMIKAYRLAPAPVLSPFIYTQIIWMLILGYVFFGNVPDLWTLVGASVVIASGLYLLHRERITGRAKTSESAA